MATLAVLSTNPTMILDVFERVHDTVAQILDYSRRINDVLNRLGNRG
jgi:hypothetical protein